jgi:hypothetical protein
MASVPGRSGCRDRETTTERNREGPPQGGPSRSFGLGGDRAAAYFGGVALHLGCIEREDPMLAVQGTGKSGFSGQGSSSWVGLTELSNRAALGYPLDGDIRGGVGAPQTATSSCGALLPSLGCASGSWAPTECSRLCFERWSEGTATARFGL